LPGELPTLVGIYHALSFRQSYFEVHRLPTKWSDLLEAFHLHWATDAPNRHVDFILLSPRGEHPERKGNPL
jgi:hypothetical protein